MTHRVRRDHHFRCDEGGCWNKEVIERVRSKRWARTKVRERGWAVHGGQHYCPDHNTKENPDGWEDGE